MFLKIEQRLVPVPVVTALGKRFSLATLAELVLECVQNPKFLTMLPMQNAGISNAQFLKYLALLLSTRVRARFQGVPESTVR